MAHIFISYSRKDIDFARYLRATLEHAGFAVWMDEKRLSAGMNWSDELENAIDTCGAFVIVMSPASQESKFVQSEILHAIDRHKPMFPVLLVGAPFFLLKAYQYEDMRAGLNAKTSPEFITNLQAAMGIKIAEHQPAIRFEIVQGDALDYPCDMLIMKVSSGSGGLEYQVAKRLNREDNPMVLLDNIGKHLIFDTAYAIGAEQSLFISTVSVGAFDYRHSREFANQAMSILAKEAPHVEHIAMTIHGVRTMRRLDASETLLAQFAGFVDAIETGHAPPALKRISIIEVDKRRADKLRDAIMPYLEEVSYAHKLDEDGWAYELTIDDKVIEPLSVTQSNINPYALAITPDDEALEDIFYYGIERPTHAMGLLCERIKLDPTEQAAGQKSINASLDRIAQARVIVCDVSTVTPLLYLQLGYAWGKGIPTVLITQSEQQDFDTAHYIAYQKIWELEERLSQWLKETVL